MYIPSRQTTKCAVSVVLLYVLANFFSATSAGAQSAGAQSVAGQKPHRLLSVPMIWLEVDGSGQRQVVSRESAKSYTKRETFLKGHLPVDHFAVVEVDPMSIEADTLKSLGEESQAIVHDLLNDLSQSNNSDGAISLWHEKKASGEEMIVGVLFLPNEIEVLGSLTAMNFARIAINEKRDFWGAAAEVVRRLAGSVVGVRHEAPKPPPIAAPPPVPQPHKPALQIVEAPDYQASSSVDSLGGNKTPKSQVPARPSPSPTPPPPSGSRLQMTVKSGESMKDIALRCYDRKLLTGKLLSLNYLERGDKLDGKVIYLPHEIDGIPLDIDKCKGGP